MGHAHTGDCDGRLPRVGHGSPLPLIGFLFLFSQLESCCVVLGLRLCKWLDRVPGLETSPVRTMPGQIGFGRCRKSVTRGGGAGRAEMEKCWEGKKKPHNNQPQASALRDQTRSIAAVVLRRRYRIVKHNGCKQKCKTEGANGPSRYPVEAVQVAGK